MDSPILTRIAKGEKSAVPDCIDRYGALVWSLARRFFQDKSEAEDAVQEVFIDLWSDAGRFDPALGAEKTFVAMIARRRMIDRMRQQRRHPDFREMDVEPALEGPSIQNDLEVQDEANRARRLLGALDKDQRRILELSIFHGCSHGAISIMTGTPLGTVKTHLRRGLMRIREAMRSGSEVTGQRVRS